MQGAFAPPVFAAVMALLTGCDRQEVLSVERLANDPSRLLELRAQCRIGMHDEAFCALVVQADVRRFLSGRIGPDEYRTLVDLPPIPPSFDEPIDGDWLPAAPAREDAL